MAIRIVKAIARPEHIFGSLIDPHNSESATAKQQLVKSRNKGCAVTKMWFTGAIPGRRTNHDLAMLFERLSSPATNYTFCSLEPLYLKRDV